MTEEEKTEEFIKENGRLYQVITIKREISETDLLNFKAQIAQVEINLNVDREKADTIEGKLNELAAK